MTPEIIVRALRAAGATVEDGTETAPRDARFTAADLFKLGLSGGPDSAEKRRRLQKALDLPERMSARQLLTVLNILTSREELAALAASVE